MKSFITTLVLAFALITSCSSKKDNTTTDEWKQLDAYHDILAAAFHPLKDSGNVEPARRLLVSLAEKGDSLALSALPEKVNNEEVKSLVDKIAADTRSLADEVIGGASDSIISLKLNPIHDQFHKIHEIWNNGEHHKEHH